MEKKDVEQLQEEVSALSLALAATTEKLNDTCKKVDLMETDLMEKERKIKMLEEELKDMKQMEQAKIASSPPSSEAIGQERSLAEPETVILNQEGLEVAAPERFHVQLGHSKPLRWLSSNAYKMDVLCQVRVASPQFDETACEFRASRGGQYKFTVEARQEGDGRVGVALYTLERDCRHDWWIVIGMTDRDGEVAKKDVMRELEEGTAVWVKVEVWKGNPRMECEFSGFLVE